MRPSRAAAARGRQMVLRRRRGDLMYRPRLREAVMQELWTTPQSMALIVVRTLVVYLFILTAFRVSGKREVGQLAPFDFALILLIANAVQNAMVGPDTSLVGGLVAAAVLLVANSLLGHLAANHRGVEKLLRGKARMLVHRGHVDEHALAVE